MRLFYLLIEFLQAGDCKHRPERVRRLRVREPAADVHGRLRLTPRVVPAASLQYAGVYTYDFNAILINIRGLLFAR